MARRRLKTQAAETVYNGFLLLRRHRSRTCATAGLASINGWIKNNPL
jgi:hypothetical protein